MPLLFSHKRRVHLHETIPTLYAFESQGVTLLWSFVLILVLVLLNGFFVSVEFAAVTSRRARIDLLAESGNSSAKIVKTWLENPATRDRLIAAAQLGITIVSLALGAVGENTFEELLTPLFNNLNLQGALQRLSPILAALPLIISLLIVTSLHVVLGEQVPKVAALHNPERFALLAARPMQIFTVVFKWFIGILDWATRQTLNLIGLRMMGEHLTVYTVEEIKHILSESEEGGVIQAPAREMLDAIFDLKDLVVRQVMIPRTEIIALEAEMPLPEIIQLTTQSKYTKFPVYEENLDQVLGILHVKDLLRAMQSSDFQDCTARILAREPIFVPETISVDTLLQQFRDNRQHIAIVLDEFGGTAGLVTLEDLLEEIVGEVSDPFDTTSPEIQTLPDGSILIDGLALIEEVNQHLGLELDDPNYDTIAGYFLGRLGRIPRVGDVVETEELRLRAESMDGLRIAQISLRRMTPPTL
jgi:CBS domain containing-hemolysin-like protein